MMNYPLMHWWLGVSIILYLLIVVAVLRWGRMEVSILAMFVAILGFFPVAFLMFPPKHDQFMTWPQIVMIFVVSGLGVLPMGLAMPKHNKRIAQEKARKEFFAQCLAQQRANEAEAWLRRLGA